MKKFNIAVIALFALVCVLLSTNIYSLSFWDWSTSKSADDFIQSMTNEENGILPGNFPLVNWSILINDKEKFKSITNDRTLLRNFVAKRVWEVCSSNQPDSTKCDSAKNFLQKSWIVENENSSIAAYELALLFCTVDPGNWFEFGGLQRKISQYLEAGPGPKSLKLFAGFKHESVFFKGGKSFVDLPIVIDSVEQTITIYSASLY